MTAWFLIIDVEAICWEGLERERFAGQGEIIEIGLAIVSPEDKIAWHGGWFVRPIINPKLSDFCRQLTSISQGDVDAARPLLDVLNEVGRQVEAVIQQKISDCIFVSWGDYDRGQFERDCARHNIAYPFGRHINLKQEFLKKHGLKRAGVSKALSHLGLNFEGTLHRGADDAVNIARIFMRDFGARFFA